MSLRCDWCGSTNTEETQNAERIYCHRCKNYWVIPAAPVQQELVADCVQENLDFYLELEKSINDSRSETNDQATFSDADKSA